MLERSQSLLQYYNNMASLQDWSFTNHGYHTPLQDVKVTKLVTDLVKGCRPDVNAEPRGNKSTRRRKQEHRNRQLSAVIVNIETDVQAE